MIEPSEHQTQVARRRIDRAALEVANNLDSPVLVMYYPDDAGIDPDDVYILYGILRDALPDLTDPLPKLNIVLHTTGGSPNASYRLAQLVRDFAANITFIIPKYAYSAGTAITLAGDRILLAHCAVLSPIDVGLIKLSASDGEEGSERLELVAMDHYIKMVAEARVRVENALLSAGLLEASSRVDEAFIYAMLKNPESAMRMGSFYRQRAIAETYARRLLEDYMLKDASPDQLERVLDGLITNAPSHDFDMDYHICSEIGLVVEEADQQLSDLAQDLLQTLDAATGSNIICSRTYSNSPDRMPFFYLTLNSKTRQESSREESDVDATK